MALKLLAPGTRKGNRHWVARGTVAGRRVEVSTDTADARIARRRAREIERRLEADIVRERREAGDGGSIATLPTFESVARTYVETRGLSPKDEARLDRLAEAVVSAPGESPVTLGSMAVAEILPMHLATAAQRLYPRVANATRNREAYTPGAAVMHFAAENQLCDWMRLRKLPEPKPRARTPREGVMRLLIANADDPDLRRFLTVIRWQGWRASETLSLRWEENVNLQAREFALYVRKARAWKRIPMHDAVLEELARVPEDKRTGKVFRWGSYQSMVFHLNKLKKRLKVEFTPHQARHAFGTDLNDADATARDMVNAGTWTSEKSVGRYVATDMRRARTVLGRLKEQ